MKNLVLCIISILCYLTVFAQGNTKITISMPQVDNTQLTATIDIEDPLQKIGEGRLQVTQIVKNGKCVFKFSIKNPSYMILMVNGKYVTRPGDYYVLIEPNDNLTFEIPSIKEADFFGWGIGKVKITGKGNEKVNLTKNIMMKYLEIYSQDPDYSKQSISYQYETTDRKLNAIDSICKLNKTVGENMKNLIKAQLYGTIMQMLFISSKRSESDSVRYLYNKYIVNKNRMDVFYKKNTVQYGGTIGSYLILSEFKNPVKAGAENFEIKNKLQYAEILVKRLKKYPEIRDYLLTKHLIASLRNGFDSTTTKLYQYYCDEADFNNPNYNTVVSLYEETEKKFAAGKPFYNFALPDSNDIIHNLSDFKGKVLVIDFWYNGCGGCRLMVPALEEMEKQFKGKNVQFISIGIDKKDLWLDGIGKYSSLGSLQLYTEGKSKEHPMMKYLNIYAYPRLIVVDKNGNIASPPPELGSRKQAFISYINALL